LLLADTLQVLCDAFLRLFDQPSVEINESDFVAGLSGDLKAKAIKISNLWTFSSSPERRKICSS
jgi:hypothetical protein